MIPLELALGFGIGLSLGLLGGGGSLLTVPALVYLVGQTPQAAVTTSLAIVGANSMVGAMFHGSHGRLDWKVALAFGSAGMFVSYLSANISRQISPELLLVIFALLMIGIGLMLLFRRPKEDDTAYVAKPLWLVSASGAAVGLLTGILGVGGGFLGHIRSGSLDWMVTLVFTSAGLLGTFIGMRISRRLSPSKLQKAFAVFVMALAVFLMIDNFPKLF